MRVELHHYVLGSALFTSYALINVYEAIYDDHARATKNITDTLSIFRHFVVHERLSVLSLANAVVCLLALLGNAIVKTFFKKLRISEKQLIYDRLVNFLLIKTVFIAAVVQPKLQELVIWALWFAAIGYLRIFGLLCRDRFEFLTFSPNTPLSDHTKVISLLLSIAGINSILWFVCLTAFSDWRIITFLLSFECFILFLDTIQTLGKYVVHLADLFSNHSLESRSIIMYYMELVTELLIQVSTFVYFIAILIFHGIAYNLIDAILMMHIRHHFTAICKKVSQYLDFRRALLYMRTQYADATEEDILAFNDDCAICRESLDMAKKLPCGHLFHLLCLRSWLAHHSSCPTCRRPLSPSFQTHSLHRLNLQLDQFILNPPNMHHVQAHAARTENAAPHNPLEQIPLPNSVFLPPSDVQIPASSFNGGSTQNQPPEIIPDEDDFVDIGDDYGRAVTSEGSNTPQHQPEYEKNYSDFDWGSSSSSSTLSPSPQDDDTTLWTSARTRPRGWDRS